MSKRTRDDPFEAVNPTAALLTGLDDSILIMPMRVIESELAPALVQLRQKPDLLEYCPDSIRDHREAVMLAVRHSGPHGGTSLQWASDRLRADKEVVTAAVGRNGAALAYASDALRDDKELVLLAVEKCGIMLRDVSIRLQDDKEVVLAAVTGRGDALYYASNRLKGDVDVMLRAVTHDGLAVAAHPSVEAGGCADKSIMMKAVNENGHALQYASTALQADKDLVIAAVTVDDHKHDYITSAVMHASLTLRRDRQTMLEILRLDGNALEFALDFTSDKELVLMAVENFGFALQFAHPLLRTDRSVVMTAVTQCGYALQHASSRLRDDREVLLRALGDHSTRLSHGSNLIVRISFSNAYSIIDSTRRKDPFLVKWRDMDSLEQTILSVRIAIKVILFTQKLHRRCEHAQEYQVKADYEAAVGEGHHLGSGQFAAFHIGWLAGRKRQR